MSSISVNILQDLDTDSLESIDKSTMDALVGSPLPASCVVSHQHRALVDLPKSVSQPSTDLLANYMADVVPVHAGPDWGP